MKSIRIGNDIRIEWPLKTDIDEATLNALDLSVEVRLSKEIVDYRNYEESPVIHKCEHTIVGNYHDPEPNQPPHDDIHDGYWHQRQGKEGKRKPEPPSVVLTATISDNTIVAYWTADKQFAVGEYDIIVSSAKNDIGQCVADQCRFVRLVAHSAEADAPQDTDVETVISLQPLTLNMNGLSAYDIAVAQGFEGTEKEWVASLSEASETAAAEAKVQAEYAKTQGDYAKEQGEATKESIAKSEAAVAIAEELNANPPKIVNGTWWMYDLAKSEYVDTKVQANGTIDILYPTFGVDADTMYLYMEYDDEDAAKTFGFDDETGELYAELGDDDE